MASGIDFANHALANQGGESSCPRAFMHSFDNTDKCVSQHALEIHIATHNLQVGVADTGLEDLDEGFPWL